MIRIIFERKILTEVTRDQAFARFDSRKFIDAVNRKEGVTNSSTKRSIGQTPMKIVRAYILNSCPDDISDNDQGNLMNWLISLYIKSEKTIRGIFEFTTSDEVATKAETYFQIKSQHLERILEKSSLDQIESIYEFILIVNHASEIYQKHLAAKEYKDAKKGTNLIYEDDEWSVFIPENKGAACQLGKNTKWCTAAPGLKYYEHYHKPEDPLIVFINKKDPEEKYQFNYGSNQFQNKANNSIFKEKIFYQLNNLVKEIKGKIPIEIAKESNKYKYEDLGNGFYKTIYGNSSQTFNQYNKLQSINDQPAAIDSDGTKAWFDNGKFHRDKLPALITPEGKKSWYDHGTLIKTEKPINESKIRLRILFK